MADNYEPQQMLGTSPIANSIQPMESPKALPLPFNFSGATLSWIVDLQNFVSLAKITQIQTVFVDNSPNDFALTITIAASRQTLTVPPRSQAFLPLLVPDPPRMIVSLAGSGSANTLILLLNVQVPSAVWSTQTSSSGTQAVADAILDATVSNARVTTAPAFLGDANLLNPALQPDAAIVGTLAAGSASTATLITGNPGYAIHGVRITIDPRATIGAAGMITASINDSSAGDIWREQFFVPTAAPTLTSAIELALTTPPGFLWRNRVANSTCTFKLSGALTTGACVYTLNYGVIGFV